jgi:hypothetical protein
MQKHSETIAKLANTNSPTADDNLEAKINLIQKDLNEQSTLISTQMIEPAAMTRMLSTIEINEIKIAIRIATVYFNIQTYKVQLERNTQKVPGEMSETFKKIHNAHVTNQIR